MLYFLQNVPWFVLFIGILVFVHEFGHFLVAKASGVKVERFSLGFGPKLFGRQWGETEYRISALPLGGYVKMLGEQPGVDLSAEDAPRAFSAKPVWVRAAIVVAGPVANVVLAFGVYFSLSLGEQTFLDTRLGIVSQSEPAWEAGLRPGDKIVAIDGRPVTRWEELRDAISGRPGVPIAVSYLSSGKRHETQVVPRALAERNLFREVETRGHVGISPNFVRPYLAVVDEDSPAGRAGLATGDLVESVDGHPVGAWHELRQYLQARKGTGPVTVQVKRGDRSLTVSLTPTAMPEGLDSSLLSSADVPGGYLGLVSQESVVETVEKGTPADRIGLEPGDRILKLAIDKDGHKMERPVGVWAIDLAAFQGVDALSQFTLTFQRGRQMLSSDLRLDERVETDELKSKHTTYVFGAKNRADVLDTYVFQKMVGPVEAIRFAAQDVTEASGLIATGFVKLIKREIPLDSVGGPIMLFEIAAKSAERGLRHYLTMMALISVNLGLLNLLPVPVLDGGHLLLFAVEAIRRRPPSIRFREVANFIGLAILLLLMAFVLINDSVKFLPH